MFANAQTAIDMATASTTQEGTAVRVRGVMTSGPEGGRVRFLADRTGGLAAFLASATDPNWANINIGDSVEVVGTLKYFNCLPEIDPITSVTVLATNRTVPTYTFTAANASAAFALRYLGSVVKITDLTSINNTAGPLVGTFPPQASGSGVNYTLNGDATLPYRVLRISTIPGAVIPSGAFNISGVVGRFVSGGNTAAACTGTDGFQMIGRSAADITNNAAPTRLSGTITSPRNDTSIAAGSTLDIMTDAYDSSSQALTVNFFLGSRLIGSASTSPYTYSYTFPANTLNGSYALRAVITGADLRTISITRNVTITGGATTALMSIAQAKLRSVGDSVIIRGVMSTGVESGNTRFIYDASAGMAIFIRGNGAPWTNLNVGDSIEVGGRITYFNCLVQVNVTRQTVLSVRRPIQVLTFDASTITGANSTLGAVYNDDNLGKIILLTNINSVGTVNQGSVLPLTGNFLSGINAYALNGIAELTFRPYATFAGATIPSAPFALQGVLGRFSFNSPADSPVGCVQGVGYQLIGRDPVGDIQPLSVKSSIADLGVVVFPNPAVDYVTINTSKGNIKSIVISNMVGQLIQNVAVTGTQSHIDVAGLAAGSYLVSISTDLGTAVSRIVKN